MSQDAHYRREQIAELVRDGRRRDGAARLSDVAIACRVGCKPSEVAAVRAELLAAGEDVPAPVGPALND